MCFIEANDDDDDFLCLSAGVMYWGDVDKLERADINGTRRRRVEQPKSNAHYFDFVLHDGYIYFTDRNEEYVSQGSPDIADKPPLR